MRRNNTVFKKRPRTEIVRAERHDPARGYRSQKYFAFTVQEKKK